MRRTRSHRVWKTFQTWSRGWWLNPLQSTLSLSLKARRSRYWKLWPSRKPSSLGTHWQRCYRTRTVNVPIGLSAAIMNADLRVQSSQLPHPFSCLNTPPNDTMVNSSLTQTRPLATEVSSERQMCYVRTPTVPTSILGTTSWYTRERLFMAPHNNHGRGKAEETKPRIGQ